MNKKPGNRNRPESIREKQEGAAYLESTTVKPAMRRSLFRPWMMVSSISALLLLMLAELGFSVRWQSPIWDEGDHLFAGYMSINAHDFSLNPEHPPMAKMVAALPLLPLHLQVPPREHRYFKDEAFYGGREFLFRNGPENGGKYTADTLLFRARMAASVFALLLAVLVYLAGSEMFGWDTGLLAMILVVFEPTMLTNGAYVTTDMALSCMFFAAVYAFYRYAKRPTTPRLVVAGIAAGLALAAKHSAILLLPMLIVLAIGEIVVRRGSAEDASPVKRSSPAKLALSTERPLVRHEALRLAGAICVISVIAIVVLWAFYEFRYSMRPDGSPMEPSLAEVTSQLPPFEAGGIDFFAKFHLLPESYLFGLVDVRSVSKIAPTFLLGKVYANGVWFFFPIVLAIKCTVGEALLLANAVLIAVCGKIRRPREVLFLLVPATVYMAAAMMTQMNIGVRHVLPIFAFLLVFAAAGATKMAETSRAGVVTVAVLLLWHICSSARCFPNYMPYANELWGGPSQIHRYLSDSSVEWGQQLKAVKAYLDANHVQHCWFAYWVAPVILPSDYGIPCKLLPTGSSADKVDLDVPETIQGPVLISYTALSGTGFESAMRNPYKRFLKRKPDAVITNGVAVYDGTFDVPLASALEYVHRAKRELMTDPQAALHDATIAVTIAPGDFDPQLLMGNALYANGWEQQAIQHYRVAMRMVADMEPSAQRNWGPILTLLMQQAASER